MVQLGGFGGSLLSDNVINLRKLQSLLQRFLLVIESYIKRQGCLLNCVDTELKVATSVS